jgi:hypothetical protein
LARLEDLQSGAYIRGLAATGIARIVHIEWFDDEAEIEDAPGDEAQAAEEAILDQATAARTIAELEAEIETLRGLEAEAASLRRSGTDTKWTELNSILDQPLMVDGNGSRRKLIVFTEPRDTLNYLVDSHPNPDWQAGGGGGHPWRYRPRGAAQGGRGLHPRQGRPGAGRQ